MDFGAEPENTFKNKMLFRLWVWSDGGLGESTSLIAAHAVV
jgi:hypothetical protein